MVEGETAGYRAGHTPGHAVDSHHRRGPGPLVDCPETPAGIRTWSPMPRMFGRYPIVAVAALAQARGDQASMLDALRQNPNMPDTGQRLLMHPWPCPCRPRPSSALATSTRLSRLSTNCASSPTNCPICTPSPPDQPANSPKPTTMPRPQRPPTARVCPRVRRTYRSTRPASSTPTYGRLVLATGERHRAADLLHSAHQRFATPGAVPFAERAAADLTVCGVHPATSTAT